MALQDGAAHKLSYSLTGDSGCRFCCLCLNAWSSISEVLDEDGNPLMICTMCKISDMKPAADADLLQAVDRLAHRKATITEANIFKRWQKASGLVHQPSGLLLDPSLRAANVLRPVSEYCHDPMHTLVANGVLNVVMWLVLVALGHHMDIWGSLYSYVKLWSNPLPFKAGNLHEIFNRKREKSCKDAKKFKCVASDLLSVYPILGVFVQGILQRGDCACKAELTAFLRCCDLMDLVMAIPLGIISPQALREAVDAFLGACKEADWELIGSCIWLNTWRSGA